jgi:Flp pilus assembly pilin Flp
MYSKLNNLLAKLKQDQRGLSTVEYVVLLVLIVAIAVAVWNVFGNSLTEKLTDAATQFDKEVVTNKVGTSTTVDTFGEKDFAAAKGTAGAAGGGGQP